jgi:uncharacterized membrane protein YdbT with pleckstrin-like domain
MKQLDKKAVWLFFFNLFIRTSLLGVVAAVVIVPSFIVSLGVDEVSGGQFLLVVAVILAIVFALTFIWAKLSFSFYKYEMTDLGFRKEYGVIYKSYTTIPYARIQNVDVRRGILARLLGLSVLQIQTAGASASFSRNGSMGISSEGILPGVSKEDAVVLQNELIKKASESKGQGV